MSNDLTLAKDLRDSDVADCEVKELITHPDEFGLMKQLLHSLIRDRRLVPKGENPYTSKEKGGIKQYITPEAFISKLNFG